MVQITCKMPQFNMQFVHRRKKREVAIMVLPCLQAGWLSADPGPSLPGGLEVARPGIQCS